MPCERWPASSSASNSADHGLVNCHTRQSFELDLAYNSATAEKVGKVWRMVVTRGIFQAVHSRTRYRFFGLPPHWPYVVAEARDFVPDGLRIIDFVEGIRFGIVERGQAIAIDGESACFRFTNHPQKSDVRQARSRIAASYV